MIRGLFVTGTDTGIGKTTVTCALLHAMRARGVMAIGMKPVASGCEPSPQGWRNDDALRLLGASGARPAYGQVNPYALPEPTAPEIAARLAGVAIDIARMQAAFDDLAAQAGCVLVEGVGGWDSPLSADIDQADLARRLGLPVLLVVGLRLGCISHARLTARAIRADGLALAGWIASAVDSRFAHADETVDILRRRINAPLLGVLPHATGASVAAVHASRLDAAAAHVNGIITGAVRA